MVNVVIPFHEIGELRRIHHEKAVKHIIGRLTYLSVVHLVQWSKSFHYARCNMIVLINSNATSCIQSVVSQNISASAAYRPTHIKPMEVGRDIIPDKIGRCELKCYTITLFNIYSLLFSGTILGVNREHLFTVAPITESRNFFTIMNLYDMLSHSSLQINTMSDSILPLTYDRVNIIIICCELFRSLTTILGVQYPTSIKALSLELNKDHVVKANLKILPRYCCHYLSLFVLSPKTPLQISVVNYHIQSLIYDTESVIIEACKVYCISVDTLDAVCSILIGTSRTLGGVYVVTKAISVSGESCNYLNSYSSFSHKTLGCESVPSCNSSSIQNSNILSFLHDRNNKSASELIVRFTSTMIFWCVESNVSPLCYPPLT
ncbi:unnamed protein product [Heterobilharzia americana]|nr:unnamed protein product [Heterobilharzia americana]